MTLFNVWAPGDHSVTTLFALSESNALHIFQCHRKLNDAAMKYVKVKKIH